MGLVEIGLSIASFTGNSRPMGRDSGPGLLFNVYRVVDPFLKANLLLLVAAGNQYFQEDNAERMTAKKRCRPSWWSIPLGAESHDTLDACTVVPLRSNRTISRSKCK
jgi:hypothetical protein